MKNLKKGGLIVALTFLFFMVSGIPYFYGWSISTPSVHFSGLVANNEDHLQYFSLAKQAEEGKFLFEDRFTTTPHAPRLINWFWWSVGRLMGLTGWTISFTHQFLRALIILLFMGTLYSFLGRYLKGHHRLIGVLLIAWGGGFGGVVRVLKKVASLLPPDFDLVDIWLPESHAFLSMMITPTYCLAVTLMLWIFISFLQGLEKDGLKYFGLCGFLNLLLLFFHPFEWGSVFLVCLLTACFYALSLTGKWSMILKGLLIVFFISLPGLFYCFYLNRLPLWKDVLGQMALTSPDPFKIALGFGLPFLLVLFTYAGVPPSDRTNPNQMLLFSWAVAGFFLLYFPVNFQFHLINGWQIPVYILALKGVEERIVPYLKDRFKESRNFRKISPTWFCYGLLFLLGSISPLYVIQAKIKNIGNHFDQMPYFIHQQEVEAIEWFKKNSLPGDKVFSGDQMGNILSAWAGNRVFTGHYCLTPQYKEKLKAVKAFWDQQDHSFNRMEFLKSQGIQYVYQGVEEKALGSYNPAKELSEVYSNRRATIFKVE